MRLVKHLQYMKLLKLKMLIESDGKSEKVKSSILLTCIGKRDCEIYNTFTFQTEEDKMKVSPILSKFTAYCNPRKNTTFLRYQFFSYNQQDGQPFDDFVTELTKRAEECAFASLKDSLITDRIVCRTTDNKLREHYLRETDLKLEKAILLGRAAEELRKHAEELKHASKPTPVDMVGQGVIPRQTKARHQSTFLTANFVVVDITVEIAQHTESYATIMMLQITSHNAALKNNADPTLNKHATGRFMKSLTTPTSERMNGRILSVR